MKTEKLKIAPDDLGKPRNPVSVAARQRSAGEHGGHQKNRRRRREEKSALRALLSGRRTKESE
jgi:hypothetical protein